MSNPEQCSSLTPLATNVSTSKTPKIALWLKLSLFRQHWQRLINTLAHANPLHLWRPHELHVWQRVDRTGQAYWYAYDPITGRSTSGSEADIRAWIEQLHYLKR